MNQAAQSSTIVLLIRHGQTPTTGQILPGRTRGLHLSEQGKIQAQEVAARMDGLKLDAVYSSPMERAQETAGPTVAATTSNCLSMQPSTNATLARGLVGS